MKINIAEIESKVLKRIAKQYQEIGNTPWVIAYSGGKDSTLVLHLVMKYLLSIKVHKRHVYVVCNDTLVESPFVMNLAREYLNNFQKFADSKNVPVSFEITQPTHYETFWVNIIGKGYPPPSRMFRWCTDRLKIKPTTEYIKRIVSKNGEVIMLLGSRFDESQQRAKSINKHLVDSEEFLSTHSTLENCTIFMPVADVLVEDLWEMIAIFKTPWGNTYAELIQLYKDALGGECPIVLSKEDTPACGNKSARFGCWVCTVVEKDKSLEGLNSNSNSNQFQKQIDFRNWLLSFSQQVENRYPFSRKGAVRKRDDGSIIPGPFTLSARKEIFQKIKSLELNTGQKLISDKEVFVIREEWGNASLLEQMTSHTVGRLRKELVIKKRMSNG
ncbi:MAG: DNA phosphorothioation system sulfurtransferase DndC [Urechidicola sp.]|nr:DNA phosphorothioation system sulfurtransferase DndC [Urechidicola sp.]